MRRRWGFPLLDLLYLAFHRDGYEKGHRHYAILWIAYLLRLALPGEPEKKREILRICREINQDFKVPLPLSTVKRQVDRAMMWQPEGHASNRFLATLFGVTAQEAALLRKLKPDSADPKTVRREVVLAAYQALAEAKKARPTLLELTTELASRGHRASLATIRRDLLALGDKRRSASRSSASRPASRLPSGTSAKSENSSRRRATRRGTT